MKLNKNKTKDDKVVGDLGWTFLFINIFSDARRSLKDQLIKVISIYY